MRQVSVRDVRGDDRDWIEQVYRDYLVDLSPSATGLFPALPDVAQREGDQWARFFADHGARVLTVCYGYEPVGFAKIAVRRAPPAPPWPRAGGGPPAEPASTGSPVAPASSIAPVPASCFSMAEFFIARSWRRRGIGAQAVRLILDRFEGAWLITEHLRNDIAVGFWRQVVRSYTGGDYQERIVNGEVQQRFLSGRRRKA